jgi:hypothetical protein
MKNIFRKYRHLSALFAVCALSFLLLPFAAAVFAIGCWQLSQFAMSRKSGYCYNSALSPEQLDEFEEILRSCKAEFPKVKGLEENLARSQDFTTT